MSGVVNKLFNDPFLPCSFLMQPINSALDSIPKVKHLYEGISDNIAFFRKYGPMLGDGSNPIPLTAKQISEWWIRLDNNRSERFVFKHDILRTGDGPNAQLPYLVKIERDPQYKNHSYMRILLSECAERAVKLVAEIALNILMFPVALVAGAIGVCVRGVALAVRSSPQKRAVKVEQLPLGDPTYEKVRKIAREWQKRASQKNNNPDYDPILSDSYTINKLIAQCVELPKECAWIYDEVFLCRDEALGLPQAIALTKKESRNLENGRFVKIAHIATNPNNIRSKVNESELTRIEGASTAIINHLAQRCLKEGADGIYLEATATARPFYEKMGFKALDPKTVKLDEDGTWPMVLAVK